MSPRKQNISADDLAAAGGQARKKKKESQKKATTKAKVIGSSYRQKKDQKRIFLHITKWSDWRFIFSWFGIMFLISGLSLFATALMMSDPAPFSMPYLSLILAGGFLASTLLYLYSLRIIPLKAKEEKKWIDNLPFQLIAFPDVLVYRSYPSIYFTIKFERKKPDLEYLLDVFGTLPYDIHSKVEFEESRSDVGDFYSPPLVEMLEDGWEEPKVETLPDGAQNVVYKFEMSNKKASKFNRHRRWARTWVHNACEVQFTAIHHKYPIESITLNDGTIELDFDWWVPVKGWIKPF